MEVSADGFMEVEDSEGDTADRREDSVALVVAHLEVEEVVEGGRLDFKRNILYCVATIGIYTERWQSGRMYYLGKVAGEQSSRGFESPSLRNDSRG